MPSIAARLRRRDEAVSVAYDACDHLPVGPTVDPDAHPALVANVRRSEEPHRILLDKRLLQTRGQREPKEEP